MKDIADIVKKTGLGSVNEFSPPDEIARALKKFRKAVDGFDPIQTALARREAISILKSQKVGRGADLVISALRGLGGSVPALSESQGSKIELADRVPWTEEVGGEQLLDEIGSWIRRYVVLSNEAETAVVLWIVHTYTFNRADITPRLALTSPTKRCGKTRLMQLLKALVRRPLLASNISPAAVFRTIETSEPTLLIDEADTFLRNSDELRGILNAGHDRESATIVRCVGDDFEPRQFTVWGPVAVALIGTLPDTLTDRSVVISMKRRAKTEPVERLRRRNLKELETLARKIARWCDHNVDTLNGNDAVSPQNLNDRAADNWEPLFAIADCVGGKWPDASRKAALRLSGDGVENHDSDPLAEQLLRDVHRLFSEEVVGSEVSMKRLADELAALEERPWSQMRGGKPLTTSYLGKLLRRFGVKPSTVRFGPNTEKGYRLERFRDAFLRYLPGTPVTPVTPPESQRNSTVSDESHTGPVTDDETPKTARDSGGVTGVTKSSGEKDDEVEERAAILEYQGGLSREEAERFARRQVEARRKEDAPS